MAKILCQRSETDSDEMKPTTAARMIAGPKLFVGAMEYIITARKMKASATDLLLWLEPSTLVTGTVNQPENRVIPTKITSGAMPVQPSNVSCTVIRIPPTKTTAPTSTTA